MGAWARTRTRERSDEVPGGGKTCAFGWGEKAAAGEFQLVSAGDLSVLQLLDGKARRGGQGTFLAAEDRRGRCGGKKDGRSAAGIR